MATTFLVPNVAADAYSKIIEGAVVCGMIYGAKNLLGNTAARPAARSRGIARAEQLNYES